MPVLLAAALLGVGGSIATDVVAASSSSLPAGVRARGVRHGIDVSHWQRNIDWHRVRRAGIDFAIAKATEGTGYVDHFYARNAKKARRAGIRFTAYHFARPQGGAQNARKQADFFVKKARLRSTDLVPALDLEQSGGLGPVALQRWVLAFLKRVETRIHAKPMVYTSPGFWTGNMANTRSIAKAGFRVLWVANYGTNRPMVPARRWNGHGWTIWQWTKCGSVAGIDGCVDRNALAGVKLKNLTISALRKKR
jgi:GH25 family lysozyme M1 (1,4-beta-N-acetylmuramidase)